MNLDVPGIDQFETSIDLLGNELEVGKGVWVPLGLFCPQTQVGLFQGEHLVLGQITFVKSSPASDQAPCPGMSVWRARAKISTRSPGNRGEDSPGRSREEKASGKRRKKKIQGLSCILSLSPVCVCVSSSPLLSAKVNTADASVTQIELCWKEEQRRQMGGKDFK